MPKTPLLMVLVQFREHIINDTFVILLSKSGLRSALGPSESVFQGYSVLGLLFRCNHNCKVQLKISPCRSWASTLKFFVYISAPKTSVDMLRFNLIFWWISSLTNRLPRLVKFLIILLLLLSIPLRCQFISSMCVSLIPKFESSVFLFSFEIKNYKHNPTITAPHVSDKGKSVLGLYWTTSNGITK